MDGPLALSPPWKRTMRLVISPSALQLGLRHARAWRLNSPHPLLDDGGLPAETALAACGPQSAESPAGYRKLLVELGYEGTVPAGERLRETVTTRGWRSHGIVIDAISIATLRHGGGVGLHHLTPEDLESDLLVTRAAGGERITPAFSSKSRPIPAGDLVYGTAAADGSLAEPFAWLGKRDCDAAARQLTEESRHALVVVLGCPDEPASHSERIGATIAGILAENRPDIAIAPVPVISC